MRRPQHTRVCRSKTSINHLINPPELDLLEREVRRVRRGKALVIPRGERTRGHGTHTLAAVWKEHLIALLGETGR